MVTDGMKEADKYSGWVYSWSRSQWKRYFLVLTTQSLFVFSSDNRKKKKKTIDLRGCCLGLLEDLFSKHPTEGSSALSSRMMKSVTKLEAVDINFSQVEAVVITLEPRKCYFLFFCKKEAEQWKVAIDGVLGLLALDVAKKGSDSPKLSSSRWFFRKRTVVKTETCTTVGVTAPPSLDPSEEPKKVEECEKIQLDPLWPDLDTLEGCTDFLRSNCLNVNTLEHMATMIDHFKSSYQMGDSSLPNELRLEAWKGTIRRIVKTMTDELIANNDALDSCKNYEEHMDQLWLACEMWVFGGVHDKIMGACKQMFAFEDSLLDKTLAKLQQVDPLALGVRAEFEGFVVGEALQQFRSLNRYRTPFEKAMCLSKTINCILNGIESLVKSCTGALKDHDGLLPCTDDLLSFMLLMMARGKVKNLLANAWYMDIFFNLRKENGGELAYHMTNFAAACNYLQSDTIKQLTKNVVIPSPSKPFSPPSLLPSEDSSWSSNSPHSSYRSFTSSLSFASSASSSKLSFEAYHGHNGGCGATHETESDATSMYLDEINRAESGRDNLSSPCFDNGGKNNNKEGGVGVFSEEKSWGVKRNTNFMVDWANNSTWDAEEEGEYNRHHHNLGRIGCGRIASGDSPNFLLASTYQ